MVYRPAGINSKAHFSGRPHVSCDRRIGNHSPRSFEVRFSTQLADQLDWDAKCLGSSSLDWQAKGGETKWYGDHPHKNARDNMSSCRKSRPAVLPVMAQPEQCGEGTKKDGNHPAGHVHVKPTRLVVIDAPRNEGDRKEHKTHDGSDPHGQHHRAARRTQSIQT